MLCDFAFEWALTCVHTCDIKPLKIFFVCLLGCAYFKGSSTCWWVWYQVLWNCKYQCTLGLLGVLKHPFFYFSNSKKFVCRVQKLIWMWRRFSFQLPRISSKDLQNQILNLRYWSLVEEFLVSACCFLSKKLDSCHLSVQILLHIFYICFYSVLQPQTIKINQPDTGASGAQAAQKSACCGGT